jgi:hypothetical protein
MRQHSRCTGTRQTCSVEQEQCAVERERCDGQRTFRREGEEEKESGDSQITFHGSAQHTSIATY